jgi:hypothetical protein
MYRTASGCAGLDALASLNKVVLTLHDVNILACFFGFFVYAKLLTFCWPS